MAVRRFELDTIPADIQARNLTGYQLTDLGFAVNKFDAASTTPVLVTDNVATTLGTVTGVTVDNATRTITFASNAQASLSSIGVVHAVGWTVIIDGGSVQARAAGTHINFWNCNMAVTGTNATGSNWTLGSTVAAGTGGSGVGQRAYQTAGTNPGAASSVNLYGCSLGISQYNAWYQVSDAIDTTVTFASSLNATNSTRWHTCQGGRWIRCTVKNGAAAGIASYGGHLLQNVIPDKLAFAVGNDGNGIPRTVLVDRPEWQDPFQTQYIVMNSPSDAELRCYVYGGPFFGDSAATTLDGTATGANFGTTDAAVASDAITARWAQGVMQFDVIAPTYLDALTREPVQGVVVRARTNALPSGLLGAGPLFDTYSERVNTEDTSNLRLGNNYICINEAITGANGRLVSNQYLTSTNGGTSFTTANGYLDFLDWNNNTTVGSASFGTGANDDAAVADIVSPEGVMILPRMRTYLDIIGGTNQATVGAYTNSQERRSYAYDVDVTENIAQPAFRAPVYVDDGDITVESLIGTRIKTANVNDENQPVIQFNVNTPETVSLNDIGMAMRQGWAAYEANTFYGDGDAPDAGPFNETTYPVRIILDTDIADAGGTTGPGYFVRNHNSQTEQIAITVFSSGIAGKSDDLYTGLNILALNLNGQELDGVEIIADDANISNMRVVNDALLTTGDQFRFQNNNNTIITGNSSFTLTSASDGQFRYLPHLVGDADGAVSFANCRFVPGSNSAAPIIKDNTVFTNTTMASDCIAGTIRNVSIIGTPIHNEEWRTIGTSTSDATGYTWNFRDLAVGTLNMDLTQTTYNGLITIETNQDSAEFNAADRVEVIRWLNDQGVTYNATNTTDDGAPSGVNFWVVAPPPEPAVQYPIVVEVPEGASGFLTIRNLDANTNEDFVVTNGAVVGTLPTIASDNTVNYRIYYKLNSTVGGATYRTSIRSISGNPGGDINITPLRVNDFFVSDASTDADLSYTFADSTSNVIRGQFSATSAGAETTRSTCQGASVTAANAQLYFNWLVHNEYTVDPIDYQPGAVLFNNSVDGATETTFAAGEGIRLVSNDTGTQTVVNNYTGYNTNQTGGTDLYVDSGIRQVFNSPIGLADIATVTVAVGGSINAAVQGPVNNVINNQEVIAVALNSNPLTLTKTSNTENTDADILPNTTV